jgi:uncharacterized protein YfaA (DUF2138 family)
MKTTSEEILSVYGARLTVAQIGKIFGLKTGSTRNKLRDGSLPIRTFTEGRNRYADYRDVAAYLDQTYKRIVDFQKSISK